MHRTVQIWIKSGAISYCIVYTSKYTAMTFTETIIKGLQKVMCVPKSFSAFFVGFATCIRKHCNEQFYVLSETIPKVVSMWLTFL